MRMLTGEKDAVKIRKGDETVQMLTGKDEMMELGCLRPGETQY